VQALSKNPSHVLEPTLEYVRHSLTVVKQKCSATSVEQLLSLKVVDEALRVNVCARLNEIIR